MRRKDKIRFISGWGFVRGVKGRARLGEPEAYIMGGGLFKGKV